MSTRYPRGLTRTSTGWRISVRVKGVGLWQKRFPASTSQEDVEAELSKARRARRAGRLTAAAGSFAADVQRYLTDYFKGRPSYQERERHLLLWTAALGPDRRRSEFTRDDLARVFNGWRAAGLAADTCNKRRTALLALYHALDGKGGSNPVRELPRFRPPDPLPRGLPYPQIEAALKQLPRCKTRARLAVMAYTGMRPGQVMKLSPDIWEPKQRLLTIPGTAKGRGTKPYVIPLSQAARDALTLFDALNAWGPFTWAPMARMWKEAWIAATTGEPRIALRGKCAGRAAPVPYDLRHSFGTAVYRATGDLKATKELLGHSSIRMSERYTLAAVPARQVAAIRAAFPDKKKRAS